MSARIEPYDEFGLFHENAAEFDLPFDGRPAVERRSIDLPDGRRLSALVWGQSEPDLVLLHGGAQNAHTWDTVALALRPTSLVAIDLPGHGHSGNTVQGTDRVSSPFAVADDVAVAIGALAPHASGVVGMSYGGLVAIALAGQSPNLVRRLVLVDVLPSIRPERVERIRAFVDGPAFFESFDDVLARTVEFNPTRSVSSLRRGILHNAVQLEDGSWVWRHMRSLASQDTSGGSAAGRIDAETYVELDRILGAVAVPILLARGMRADSVLTDDDEAKFRVQHPDAAVVRFADAGHGIQGDSPVRLARCVWEFLQNRG